MPEAPVNVDRRPVLRQHQIRVARNLVTAQTIPEAQRVQIAPNLQLWSRIMGLDRPHDLGSSLRAEHVCHRVCLFA